MYTLTVCALLLLPALMAGCKEVHMLPTKAGWVEMEIDDDGNEITYKPAEKIEVDYDD